MVHTSERLAAAPLQGPVDPALVADILRAYERISPVTAAGGFRKYREIEWLRDKKGRWVAFVGKIAGDLAELWDDGAPNFAYGRLDNSPLLGDSDSVDLGNDAVARIAGRLDPEDATPNARVVMEVGRDLQNLGKTPVPPEDTWDDLPEGVTELPTDGSTVWVRRPMSTYTNSKNPGEDTRARLSSEKRADLGSPKPPPEPSSGDGEGLRIRNGQEAEDRFRGAADRLAELRGQLEFGEDLDAEDRADLERKIRNQETLLNFEQSRLDATRSTGERQPAPAHFPTDPQEREQLHQALLDVVDPAGGDEASSILRDLERRTPADPSDQKLLDRVVASTDEYRMMLDQIEDAVDGIVPETEELRNKATEGLDVPHDASLESLLPTYRSAVRRSLDEEERIREGRPRETPDYVARAEQSARDRRTPANPADQQKLDRAIEETQRLRRMRRAIGESITGERPLTDEDRQTMRSDFLDAPHNATPQQYLDAYSSAIQRAEEREAQIREGRPSEDTGLPDLAERAEATVRERHTPADPADQKELDDQIAETQKQRRLIRTLGNDIVAGRETSPETIAELEEINGEPFTAEKPFNVREQLGLASQRAQSSEEREQQLREGSPSSGPKPPPPSPQETPRSYVDWDQVSLVGNIDHEGVSTRLASTIADEFKRYDQVSDATAKAAEKFLQNLPEGAPFELQRKKVQMALDGFGPRRQVPMTSGGKSPVKKDSDLKPGMKIEGMEKGDYPWPFQGEVIEVSNGKVKYRDSRGWDSTASLKERKNISVISAVDGESVSPDLSQIRVGSRIKTEDKYGNPTYGTVHEITPEGRIKFFDDQRGFSRSAGIKDIVEYEDFGSAPKPPPPSQSAGPSRPPRKYGSITDPDSGARKVGRQAGSNPGGFYQIRNKDTGEMEDVYVKKAHTPEHGANEELVNTLYRELGVQVPDLYFNEDDGNLYSPIIPGEQNMREKISDPEWLSDFRRNFVVDAFLANWDSAGLVLDNVVTGPDGKPARIDNGGGLLYRAQGSPKGGMFSGNVGELDTLRDPNIAPNYYLYDDMTEEEEMDGAMRIAQLSPERISELVHAAVPQGGGIDADKLTRIMEQRRRYILASYGIEDPYQ